MDFNVIGQRVPHDRSGDMEASWSGATCPGTRCGKVSLCKMGTGPDFLDGAAGSTEICKYYICTIIFCYICIYMCTYAYSKKK